MELWRKRTIYVVGCEKRFGFYAEVIKRAGRLINFSLLNEIYDVVDYIAFKE